MKVIENSLIFKSNKKYGGKFTFELAFTSHNHFPLHPTHFLSLQHYIHPSLITPSTRQSPPTETSNHASIRITPRAQLPAPGSNVERRKAGKDTPPLLILASGAFNWPGLYTLYIHTRSRAGRGNSRERYTHNLSLLWLELAERCRRISPGESSKPARRC